MLDSKTINKIEEFVYAKPRSVQEIAELIKKNWRTADRYIDEIQKNFGTISTRVFRGGTRGALKIIYWSSVEKVSSSIFQEKLEKEIFNCKKKEDFSAFDIFQHIPEKNRKSFVFDKEEENISEFKEILLNAKKQMLFFSGNLSFVNIKDKNETLFEIFEKIIQKKVNIKILCRVDLAGIKNIEKLLSLNLKHGKNLIEIRHDLHSIRGVITDGNFIRLKEVKEPTGKINELNKKKFIFYNISDKSWAEWLSKIFWNKFSNSIDANKRIEHLKQINFK
jgi:hypothetical protein